MGKFSASQLTLEGDYVRVATYCMIFRHDSPRQYWLRSPSWRMGAWHALFRYSAENSRVADLNAEQIPSN